MSDKASSWEIWHDEDGLWLGRMDGELVLELKGPYATESEAEIVKAAIDQSGSSHDQSSSHD